jgi:hypothetical protein
VRPERWVTAAIVLGFGLAVIGSLLTVADFSENAEVWGAAIVVFGTLLCSAVAVWDNARDEPK